MKKVLFALMAVALLGSASSCKKCGYCIYPNGDRSDAVCKQNNALGTIIDEYKEAEADCQAAGGNWEKTK